jgi:hypothetical protein
MKQIIEVKVAPLPHGRLGDILPSGEVVVGTSEEALLAVVRELWQSVLNVGSSLCVRRNFRGSNVSCYCTMRQERHPMLCRGSPPWLEPYQVSGSYSWFRRQLRCRLSAQNKHGEDNVSWV